MLNLPDHDFPVPDYLLGENFLEFKGYERTFLRKIICNITFMYNILYTILSSRVRFLVKQIT